jgi:hypothetical protein
MTTIFCVPFKYKYFVPPKFFALMSISTSSLGVFCLFYRTLQSTYEIAMQCFYISLYALSQKLIRNSKMFSDVQPMQPE